MNETSNIFEAETMKKDMVQYFMISAFIILTLSAFFSNVGKAENDQNRLHGAHKVPGLTSEDKFPNGCVDCHINMPDINQEERISTLMTDWTKKVEIKLLKKAQSVASDIKLKGMHPLAVDPLEDIPSACISFHSKTSKMAPPFAALLHIIHLNGGDENHFLTIFQGESTHCHKMNVATGSWIVPSGPEK